MTFKAKVVTSCIHHEQVQQQHQQKQQALVDRLPVWAGLEGGESPGVA